MTTLDRFRGCLLGLAAGDALGTTLEFTQPGSFERLTDMVGGGPFKLKPGEWTDDTSMALCLAESLVTKKGFDPVHQLETYCLWWRTGHLSVNGRCFDIGNATRAALARFERLHQPDSGSRDPSVSGNGSLMRLAPVPLAFASKPKEAIQFAAESSKTTHASWECLDACRYFAGLIVGAVQGRAKGELLADLFCPVPGLWKKELSLNPQVDSIANGSFRRQPPQIRGSGWVIHTLEAALWAFHSTDSFREGALKVVNLGEDADTTGAVYGQIAGAFYGVDGIPADWRAKLAKRELIEQRAVELHTMSGLD